MFKQKRAFTSEGQANTIGGAPGQAAQAQVLPQGMTLGPQQNQEALLQISIEQALQQSTTMPLDEFVTMVQRMQFNVKLSKKS